MSLRRDIDFARKNDLTIEEVKACPMFSHLTDTEAQEVIDTLRRFTIIVYSSYKSDKKVNNISSTEKQ